METCQHIEKTITDTMQLDDHSAVISARCLKCNEKLQKIVSTSDSGKEFHKWMEQKHNVKNEL